MSHFNCYVPNLRLPGFIDSYKKAKIGNCLKIKSGQDQKGVSCENGKYNIYGTGGIIGTANSFLYDKQSVGIGRKGTIDKPFFFDEPFWAVDTLFYSVIFSDYFPKYIYYLFQTINWKKYNSSTGVPSLTSSAIESIDVFVPSFKEQCEISKLLAFIDKQIETQNKILNGLESLRFSLSYILFRHLDRYSKLEDIANIIKGKQINSDILNDDFSYPVYNGGINASGFYNTFNSENCITISEGGNSCGTVRFVKDKFWSGGHNYVIVCKNGIIDQFLYYYLKHNENKIMSLRVGSGLPNIQKSSLSEFKIKITNIEEQKKIAAKLGAIDSKINNEKKLLELFQKQKIFLLNNLFI